ncbi:MAG: alpha/beta fold hydrolase [Mariprofundales bacterium]
MSKITFLSGWSYDSACWGKISVSQENNNANDKHIIIAWSLGALQAMQIAVREPQNVQALVLIAATPSFCNHDDWLHGCPNKVFSIFERGLSHPVRLLDRFDKLAIRGDIFASPIPRHRAITSTQFADSAKLADGLSYLKNTDLRENLPTQPCLLLHGCNDVITPIAAAHWLSVAMPQAFLHEIASAGHAPMWTHATECNQVLNVFLANLNEDLFPFSRN